MIQEGEIFEETEWWHTHV